MIWYVTRARERKGANKPDQLRCLGGLRLEWRRFFLPSSLSSRNEGQTRLTGLTRDDNSPYRRIGQSRRRFHFRDIIIYSQFLPSGMSIASCTPKQSRQKYVPCSGSSCSPSPAKFNSDRGVRKARAINHSNSAR
jgi:hypothetical protein